MKEFIIANYKLLILCFCALLELVSIITLSILTSKKTKKNEPYYQVISKLPLIIEKVEKFIGSGNGAKKKAKVLSIALDSYKALTGIELAKDSKIAVWIDEAIEEILKTPQKKEVK